MFKSIFIFRTLTPTYTNHCHIQGNFLYLSIFWHHFFFIELLGLLNFSLIKLVRCSDHVMKKVEKKQPLSMFSAETKVLLRLGFHKKFNFMKLFIYCSTCRSKSKFDLIFFQARHFWFSNILRLYQKNLFYFFGKKWEPNFFSGDSIYM